MEIGVVVVKFDFLHVPQGQPSGVRRVSVNVAITK